MRKRAQTFTHYVSDNTGKLYRAKAQASHGGLDVVLQTGSTIHDIVFQKRIEKASISDAAATIEKIVSEYLNTLDRILVKVL